MNSAANRLNPLNPFLKRLPRYQTLDGLRKIARSPSYSAPRAEDVQSPQPFLPPIGPALSEVEKEIAQQPSRDDLRLALADRFDRQHDPRGIFIRTQIEIARTLRNHLEPTAVLFEKEAELLQQHYSSWTSPWLAWGAQDFVFRRGCIERLSMTGRAFIALGHTLFESLPLRLVRFVAVKNYLEELTQTNHIHFLEQLDFSGNQLGLERFEILTRPLWNQLRGLELKQNELTNNALPLITQSRWRWQLRRLGLAENQLTAVDVLIHDPALVELQSLDLSSNPIGNRPLAAIGQLPSLTRLSLSNCDITSIDSLFDQGYGKKIRSIDLSFNEIRSYDCLKGKTLHSLSLRGNRIKPGQLKSIALPTVRYLDLAANFLGEDVVGVVQQCRDLVSLDLSNCLLTERIADELFKLPIISQLSQLKLDWNNLSLARLNERFANLKR